MRRCVLWMGVAGGVLALAVGCHHPSSSQATVEDATLQAADTYIPTTINVGDGFEKDTVSGHYHAQRDLHDMADVCEGYVGRRASTYLQLTRTHALRLGVSAPETPKAALVMAVMDESGRILCSDGGNGPDPEILAKFKQGEYRVWIGAQTKGETGVFELTATDPMAMAPSGPSPKPMDAGTSGGVVLTQESGPARLMGQAGGARLASDIGPGCDGFIALRPDHVLRVKAPIHVEISAHATDADLVLLLQNGDGEVLCNDDARGQDPAISEHIDAGTWNVYVGTYAPSHYPPYVLHVSR